MATAKLIPTSTGEPVAAIADREVPVAMSPDEFRALGHELVERLAVHLETLGERRVKPAAGPSEMRRILGADQRLPQAGSDSAVVLREATNLLTAYSTHIGHPRFLGYITSGGTPLGALGDFLASAINPNVGAWKLAPMASEIEAQTVRWIAELIGFPTTAGGLLVSGGNMANFLGVFAARAAKATWDVRREGMGGPGAIPMRIYASTETHTWVQKAADLAGMGTNAIRWVPVTRDLTMYIGALASMVDDDRRSGLLPLMVIGSAGTVSTGAVDPLPAIAAFCREQDLWFHVDGAYGAVATGVPGAPRELEGLREADSLALDPHKWLYSPLEAGCALVRNAGHLRQAFNYNPAYYHFDGEGINFYDYGMQNSRGFRALKVWLGLRQAGSDGVRRMVADDIALAGTLFHRLQAHPDFEAATRQLSITTFRYIPPDLRAGVGDPAVEAYLNRLNQSLLDEIEASGVAFLSQAVVGGRFLLRACVVNFRTTTRDMHELPGLIAGMGRSVDSRLRQEAQ